MSCPVALYTAASTSERIAFNTLNRATGNRVRREFIDSETGEPVEKDDQVKGYETENGHYIVVDPEEVAAAVPNSDKTLTIESFIPCSDIDTMYFDKPYYLTPDKMGKEAYVLLREGMKKAKVVVIARTVLFRRLRTVLIRPHGKGLIASTLNFDYEVRSSQEAFEDQPDVKSDPELLEIAELIIEKKDGSFDVSTFDDRYEEAVKEENEVKGYARGESDYIILEDDELENVALDSTRTIDISTFTPRDTIEWIWLDTPYYLSPSEKVAQEAFAVIRDAMASQDMVGISRLVISRRERAVMLEPRGKGIVLWTLRYRDEVRDEDSYFDSITDEKPDADMMPLIQKLIKKQTKPWDAKMVVDPVQDRLLDIIKAKKKQHKKPARGKTRAPASPSKPSNVINIMDALKKSVAAETRVK